RQFGIRQPGEGGDLRFAEARPFARYIEPAVAGETCQGGAFEVERWCAAAGRYVFHRGERLAAARRSGKRFLHRAAFQILAPAPEWKSRKKAFELQCAVPVVAISTLPSWIASSLRSSR